MYNRITILDRRQIQDGLNLGMSVSDIAKQINKSSSTVKREIERNFDTVKSKGNDCLNKKNCKERNACYKECNHKLCKQCKSIKCYEECSNYVKAYCDRLCDSSPHVCNGCPKIQRCSYEQNVYKAGVANSKAEQKKQSKIRPFRVSDEKLREIDEYISPLLKNGQSPEAALSTVKHVVGISSSTLRRMIDRGALTARNIDLPEKVSRRPRRKTKRKNKDIYAVISEKKKGHLYADYLSYLEEHDDIVVEMDCVEGRKTDKEAILSLHWKEFHMQLYFIMPVHDAANVVEQLDIIEEALGLDLFRECLPIILTDNGEEFSDIDGMERSCTHEGEQRTHIFFCEPNRSDEKGSCERNHRLLRRIIPKCTSWNDSRNMSIHGLTQFDMNLATNHINSYARPDMNYLSPYAAAMPVLSEDFFILLGLEVIPPKEILLKPELIYRK